MFRTSIFPFLWFFQSCQSKESFEDVRRIILEKIKPDSRRPYIRPAVDQSLATDTFIFFLIQDFEIHQRENKLDVNAFFYTEWVDQTISWMYHQTSQGTLATTYISMRKNELSVWTPTFFVRNTVGQKSYLGNLTQLIGIDVGFNGNVGTYGFHKFTSECQVDMTYFPFDTQVCSFEITGKPSEILISRGICVMENTNPEWVNAEVNYTLSETSLTCTIKATRKPTFLIMNLIVPTALIGFLYVFVFIVPAHAGEKLQYCVSILLSFNVYLGILVDNVPVNSEKMSLLSYFIIYQYMFGALVITVTAALLRTVHSNKSKEVPRKWQAIVRIEKFVKCKKKCLFNRASVRDGEAYSQENSTDQSKAHSEVTWKAVCSACDFFLFWLFLFVQVIGNLYFFLLLQ